jgi:hypothetical protein
VSRRSTADAVPGPDGSEDGGIVDRADYDPDYDPSEPVACEACGAEMYYTAACKLKCPRCGYTRDCSDP